MAVYVDYCVVSYYLLLRSQVVFVLIARGPPPTSYILFFFLAGAPSRSYGNQHQHSDQTATAAFPSGFGERSSVYCI